MTFYDINKPTDVPILATFDDLVIFITLLPPKSNTHATEAIRNSPTALSATLANLQTLKVLGRDPSVSRKLTKDAVECLFEIVNSQYSMEIVVEGLSISANALLVNLSLLSELPLRHIIDVLISLYNSYSRTFSPRLAYIFWRLWFLLTFKPRQLSDSDLQIVLPLATLSLRRIGNDVDKLNHMDPADAQFSRLAIIEVLKVMYNTIHNYPDQSLHRFENNLSMQDICKGLCFINEYSTNNADIARYVFNCLMCASTLSSWFKLDDEQPDADGLPDLIDFSKYSSQNFELVKSKPASTTTLLTKILEYALFATHPQNRAEMLSDATFSSCLSCLSSIINRIYDSSFEDTPKIQRLRSIAESYLIPSKEDRQFALGDSKAPHSLCHAFIKFSADLSLQSCNSFVQHIYWKLCHENENELVEVMGFGFASGVLSNASNLFSGSSRTQRSSKIVPVDEESDRLTSTNREANENNMDSLSTDECTPSPGSLGPTDYSPVGPPNATTESLSNTAKSQSSSNLSTTSVTSASSSIRKFRNRTKSIAKGTVESAKNCISELSRIKSNTTDTESPEGDTKTEDCIVKDALSSLKSTFSFSSIAKPHSPSELEEKSQSDIVEGHVNILPSENVIKDSSAANLKSKSDSFDNGPFLSGNEIPELASNMKEVASSKTKSHSSAVLSDLKSDPDISSVKQYNMDTLQFRMREIQENAKRNPQLLERASADWTDEEKEREAERLFVLFERLKKNGVIKVNNPVEVWQQEGKFDQM